MLNDTISRRRFARQGAAAAAGLALLKGVTGFAGNSAFASENVPSGNHSIFDNLMNKGDIQTPAMAWNAQSPAEHWAWREEFAPKLKEVVGLSPDPVLLRVEWTETYETDRFVRHKIYVQTEADYWVPAYYFLPKERRKKSPALICLHGHSGILPYIREGDEAQLKKSKDHELDFAVVFAEHGYITLAPVIRGWNETVGPNSNGCHRMTISSFMIGMTPIGLRTWDNMRLLDFLETQEDVDSERIGVAGLSGGGMGALFFAALEERLRLAMVGGYFCTFRDSIYEIHHCICNCVPHIMEWGEMSDLGALFAPRPALMISGTEDSIFPIEATRRAYDTLQKTYRLLGAEDNLDRDFFPGPHSWSNRKTLQFLRKHFG